MMFDLADFLSWKATGSLARSQSTLTCKWTYLATPTPGWQRDFLDTVGLDDLLDKAGLPEGPARSAPISVASPQPPPPNSASPPPATSAPA